MTIVQLILLLVCMGVVLLAINSFIPMDAKIKKILNIVVVIIAVIICLYAFGVLPIKDARVPHLIN